MKIKNKVKFALIILISIFALLNAVWFIYIESKYAPYKDGLSYAGDTGQYYGNKSNCGIGVLYPRYLDFKNCGDISLTHKNERCGISLHVWLSAPLGDNENKYGITIYKNTSDNGANGLTQSHAMYVNQNGYPVEDTMENLETYNNYKEDIEFVFSIFNSLK